MKTIKKPLRAEYFDDILTGKKKFELKLNDFEIKEGDVIILQEVENFQLTGREIEKKVTYVYNFMTNELEWPADDVANEGLQIISFSD